MKIISASEKETREAGRKFAEQIKRGDTIGLDGELGSGKTQFVKGICEYFGVKDIVNSPTFIIVNEYSGLMPESGEKLDIYHFDLYRLNSPEELEAIGFYEYINRNGITVIEWSGLAEKLDGVDMKKIFLRHGSTEKERIIEI